MEGYELLPDTIPFLDYLQKNRPDICLGITTNTPIRSIETVLPMMGIHDRSNNNYYDYYNNIIAMIIIII